jgi:hypothetical protein
MVVLSALMLMFIAGVMFLHPDEARADCVPWCIEDTPGYNGVTGGLKDVTYSGTTYYVYNRSSETAWVAISYLQPGDPYASCVGPAGSSCDKGDKWVTKGWYEVAPGQKRWLVKDYANRYLYIYAKASNGGSWSGSNYDYIVDGRPFTNAGYSTPGARRVGFIKVDLGNNNATYTHNLNP